LPVSLVELEQFAGAGLCIEISLTVKCQRHKLFRPGKGQDPGLSVDVGNQLVFSIKRYKLPSVIDSKTGDLLLVILNHGDTKADMGMSIINRGQVITGPAVRSIPRFMDCQRFQLCTLQYISATIQATLQSLHIVVSAFIPLL